MIARPSPLQLLARRIELGLPANFPIYIGRKPESAPHFVSLSRGMSQGLLYGYGTVAYMYTTVNVCCRERNYENLEELLLLVVKMLNETYGIFVLGISPITPVPYGGTATQTESDKISETLEISITAECLERI